MRPVQDTREPRREVTTLRDNDDTGTRDLRELIDATNHHPNQSSAVPRTPGCSSVAASRLAPRLVSLRLKFQPNTPPPAA